MTIWVRASLAGIGVTVTNPRSVHRNRTDPSLHLARGLITLAHHPAVPTLVRKIGMRGKKASTSDSSDPARSRRAPDRSNASGDRGQCSASNNTQGHAWRRRQGANAPPLVASSTVPRTAAISFSSARAPATCAPIACKRARKAESEV